MTRRQRIAVAVWRSPRIRREIAAFLADWWRDPESRRKTWRGPAYSWVDPIQEAA